jgi:hypothetical protein
MRSVREGKTQKGVDKNHPVCNPWALRYKHLCCFLLWAKVVWTNMQDHGGGNGNVYAAAAGYSLSVYEICHVSDILLRDNTINKAFSNGIRGLYSASTL